MAKKKKGEDAQPAADGGGGGGSKKVLLAAVVIGLAVLGAGAMAGGLIGGGGDAEASEPTPVASATPTPLGTLVELDSLTINLADGRFLKVGAAVELAAEVAEAPATAPIYDALIAEFNRRTVEELTDPAVRDATKSSLLGSLSATYGDAIVGIYYTEFVMQ